MKKYIIITADTNDADYITECSPIQAVEGYRTEEEIEALFTKLAGLLKNQTSHHNWPDSEYSDETPRELYVDTGLLTEEELDIIQEVGYIPHGEYGVHTIESIQILVVQEEIKLL